MKITVPNVEQIADWGSEEPWTARIVIGLPDIIKSARVQDENIDDLLWIYQQIGDELSNAFISYRKIITGNMLLLEAKKEYSNLYGHLWAAYRDRMKSFMEALGYDIGFVFKKSGESFRKGLSEYVKQNNLPDDFESQVIHDRGNWQNILSKIRNDHNEHRKLPSDIDEKYFKKEVAEVFFNNVWQAIEDFIAVHLMVELEKTSKTVRLVEIPEQQRDPHMPIRFRIGLSEEALASLEKSRKK